MDDPFTRSPPSPRRAGSSHGPSSSRRAASAYGRPLSRRALLGTAGALAASSALAGCSSGRAAGGRKVRIGWWAQVECIAVTYLWQRLLQEHGYEVDLVFADQGPVFEGVADGSLDLCLDAWSPITHRAYLDRYEGKIDLLDPWYRTASVRWAVPSYVPVSSLDEVADDAALFKDRIVTIEPGAGVTAAARERVVPAYGLGSMELVTSSTTAMLSELDRAVGRHEPILVTLWHPHWAYAKYDLTDLTDPLGALGDAEVIMPVTRPGLADDMPDVVRWLDAFEMDDERFSAFEQTAVEEAGVGHEAEGVGRWLDDADNRALADGWFV